MSDTRRRQRALAIFGDIAELADEARQRQLDALCGDDAELHAQVQALLDADAGTAEPFSGNASAWGEALARDGLDASGDAMIGRSIGGALLVGTVFGAVFYTTHLVWVGEFLGPVPWLALAGLEAVLFGAGAVPIALAYRWTARYPARGLVQLLAVPPLIGVLWTAREVVMGAWP